MPTAPLRSPSSMRLAISAISAGVATLCAPSPVGRKVAGIAEHRHPHLDLADAHAVVDEPSLLPLPIPAIDVGRADLELERRRDAVERLKPVRLLGLPVRVEVDEARGDHEAARVDDRLAGERRLGDRGNLSAADADAAHGVEARLRIDDAALDDDEVEVLRGGRCGQAEREPALAGPRREETCEQTTLHCGADLSWLRFAVMSSGSLAPAFILSVIVSPLTLPV